MPTTNRPPKKFSHIFLGVKMCFVSIMVTTLIFCVLNFAFKIDGVQTSKWTFLKCPKTM